MLPKKLLLLLFLLVVGVSSAYFYFSSSTTSELIEKIEKIELPLIPKPTLPPVPTTKTLPGGTQVFQTFNNCGPAALSMALSHFDLTVSQKTLGDSLRPYQVASGDNDDKSTTLAEMAKVAKEYGFATYHRPNGNMELLKHFIAQDIPVIVRTWTKEGEDIGHYRVVKGYNDTQKIIIQDDSLQGKDLTYSYSSFNSLWEAFNFEYLVLVPQEKIKIAQLIIGDNLNEKKAWENALKLSQQAPTKTIYTKFNEVVALYHLARYQEAAALYESIESSLPFRMLWYQIEPILTYQKLGGFDKVFQMTDKIIENQNRAFSESYQIRGEIYEALGNTSQASQEFAKVALYNKNFFKYWQ